MQKIEFIVVVAFQKAPPSANFGVFGASLVWKSDEINPIGHPFQSSFCLKNCLPCSSSWVQPYSAILKTNAYKTRYVTSPKRSLHHAGLHFDQRSFHSVALIQAGAKKTQQLLQTLVQCCLNQIARARNSTRYDQICFETQPFLALVKHTLCSVLCE